MKIKNLLLLTLLSAVSLVAAEASADAAATKDDGKPSCCEGGKRRMGPPEIPGVSKDDMKKLHEAFKATKDDPSLKDLHEAVKAAHEKVKAATNDEDKKAAREEMKKAYKALMEAHRELVLKNNPELADTMNKVRDFMKKRFQEKHEAKDGSKDDDELPPPPPPPPAE
jgi:hypothetical protein